MAESSVSIRLNPFKGAEGPEGTAVPWSRWGRILDERPLFTLDPLLHAGCYYVQDSSAMFVGHVFRNLPDVLREDVRVLDLCAAPGGKTTDLAASLRERFGDRFLLVANEVMKQRYPALCDNVARWGDPRVFVCSADPGAFAQLGPYFDIIVADVPCSGEGMFRKDERARREWSPSVVSLCESRQRRIISDVWPALREGGCLLYSTCTYEKCENDDNLEWVARNLGGEIIGPVPEFTEYGVETTAHGHLLRSGVVPGEGQWAGAMIRTSGNSARVRTAADCLKLYNPGGRKGTMKGDVLVPEADYALSIGYAGEYPSVELDREAALHFLHCDTLCLPDAPMGYVAVKFHGHPLGFVKNLGRRCNNLHPHARRILMNI